MADIGNKEVMARNLLYYIEKSGKSQKEIAEIVDVAPSTFNAWVKAKKYPRIDKIEMLADYFRILKSDLIEDKSEMQKNNDAIADIVIKMRTDPDFLSIVGDLYKLDAEQREALRPVLSALLK